MCNGLIAPVGESGSAGAGAPFLCGAAAGIEIKVEGREEQNVSPSFQRRKIGQHPANPVFFHGLPRHGHPEGDELSTHRSGQALFWAAVLNGVVAAPLMEVNMMMASSTKVMGRLVLSPYLKAIGWSATAVMLCACIGLFFVWR
jgi:hypothetical protein